MNYDEFVKAYPSLNTNFSKFLPKEQMQLGVTYLPPFLILSNTELGKVSVEEVYALNGSLRNAYASKEFREQSLRFNGIDCECVFILSST